MADNAVVIIEDDEKMVETLEQMFIHKGFRVVTYKSGHEALEQLPTLTTPPSVIVLDLLMPGVDGFDVLRILRHNHKSKTPVVVLTNLSQEADRIRAMGLGADTFLVKSMCSSDEIVFQVSSWIGKTHELKQEVVKEGA